MTNKDFKEGMSITCEIHGIKIDNAKLHLEDGNWFICHNVKDEDECCLLEDRLGYKCDFNICDDWTEGDYDVTNLQPKHRTIDDLEEGDYVDRVGGCKRKCLAVCGNVYFMSEENNDDEYGIGFTIGGLKRCRYTLYQPDEPKEESDIDKCIKVVEEHCDLGPKREFSVDVLVQALKNLKNN